MQKLMLDFNFTTHEAPSHLCEACVASALGRPKQADLFFGFKASLAYIVSSRTAMDETFSEKGV